MLGGKLQQQVFLKEVKQIQGLGEEVIGVQLEVIIPQEIQPIKDTALWVEVELKVDDLNNSFIVTQYIPTSAILPTQPPRVQLEGTLWLKGRKGTVDILETSATIYYTSYEE